MNGGRSPAGWIRALKMQFPAAVVRPAPAGACPVHLSSAQIVSRRALLPLLSLPLVGSGAWAAPGPAAAGEEGATAAAAASSAEAEVLRRQYDTYAETYDDLDGGLAADALGFPALRAQLLAQAAGDVLEVGVGTGLNLQYYRPQQLTSLTAVDLSEGMLRQAQRRAQALGLAGPALPLAFRQADVAALPFPPAAFDCVVDTFSLCVFPDPLGALRSMAAALRHGGRLLLLEHSRSTLGPLGWYQDLTAPAVTAMGKGCAWNQDVPALVAAAGLRVARAEPHLGGLIVLLEAERA